MIGKYLAEKGIPVISADSLVLGSSDAVNLVIALMTYTATPADALNRFYLIHLLLKKEGRSCELANFIETIAGKQSRLTPLTETMPEEEKNKIIAQNREIEKQDFQNNIYRFNTLLKNSFSISVQRDKWINLPLLTLAHTLIGQLDFPAADPYLIGLIDLVNDYTENKGNSLNAFLKWWLEKGAGRAVTSPENTDAVRIMTIHKSKGKEFPVVIMPVLNKSMKMLTKPKTWQRLDEKETGLPVMLLRKGKDFDEVFGGDEFAEECALTALDETNVIYVGQTRPKDALYLIADKKRENEKQSSGSGDIFNYSLMLEDFIQNNDADFTEIDGCFWYGNYEHTCSKTPAAPEATDKTTTQIPVSSFSQESLILADSETEKQEVGIAVHSYFENATRFPMTEQEADQWTFEEGQPYQNEIRAALKSLTQQPALLPYFADGLTVLKEISLLTKDGLRRRPDRVVQLNGETVVIDFKTGEPTDEAKRKYRSQVDEYVQILQDMGFPNVRGELLYL